MILLYKVLITLLYPFLIIVIYVRKLLKKEDAYRFKEKIGFLGKKVGPAVFPYTLLINCL